MDDYLKIFIEYLKNRLENNLAGVIIYGSYTKGYFDSEKSDYNLFVLFKDNVIDIRDEINTKFPKISLQIFSNLKDFENKIMNGGWNTYIAFIFSGRILYSSAELINLQTKISKLKPEIVNLDLQQKEKFINKLMADSEALVEREGFNLNKFFHSSLLRKLQILYYLRENEILLEFNDLIKKIKDEFIESNYEWLIKIEKAVFSRQEAPVRENSDLLYVLQSADFAIRSELKI